MKTKNQYIEPQTEILTIASDTSFLIGLSEIGDKEGIGNIGGSSSVVSRRESLWGDIWENEED